MYVVYYWCYKKFEKNIFQVLNILLVLLQHNTDSFLNRNLVRVTYCRLDPLAKCFEVEYRCFKISHFFSFSFLTGKETLLLCLTGFRDVKTEDL